MPIFHGNPVKDGLVAEPQDWLYSNYLEWIGKRDGTMVDRDFIRQYFPESEQYVSFVMDYHRSRKLPPEMVLYLKHIES